MIEVLKLFKQLRQELVCYIDISKHFLWYICPQVILVAISVCFFSEQRVHILSILVYYFIIVWIRVKYSSIFLSLFWIYIIYN